MKQRKRYLLMVKLALFAGLLHAEPAAVADEAFLLFLADMVEVDGALTDALDMADAGEMQADARQLARDERQDFDEQDQGVQPR